MARSPNTRRRLEQFLDNTRCEANVLSAVHGVPMADVAGSMGLEVASGQSSFALRAGTGFERAILADDAARLREQLDKAGVLPGGAGALLDLRLRQQGGPCRDLDEACRGFERALRGLAEGASGGPTIVVGAALRLPVGEAPGDGVLALDVVVVDRRGARPRLVVGEIKSYADRGGHTDRSSLAAARAQAGLYVHVLRRWVGGLGLGDRVGVSDEGFLVLRHVAYNYPKVRYPEDLRWQSARAEQALAAVRAALGRPMPEGEGGEGERRRLRVVREAPKALSEGCLRFCELASHCHACAMEAGDPVVLGDEVARLVGGLSLGRVEQLLEGATPANDHERALMERFEAAAG